MTRRLIAVVGPTATGKSALAVAIARAFDGEIVSCDSTAVYRGIDIGTDKPPLEERGGVPHHLIDVAEPTETYTAARFGHDAGTAVREITARGRLPVLAGGTGFYYRALVRGLFPGPARDEPLRDRLDRVAARRGVESLHRWLSRVDPESALRIQPRDRKRLVRALEVYLLTGSPLTSHFDATASADRRATACCRIGLNLPREDLRPRVARRVDQQIERGVVDEVERLLAAGVPASAHAFSGLVYRQVIELLAGARDEDATRDLIVRENMRYARRQLIWFRKEADVRWLARGGGDTGDSGGGPRARRGISHDVNAITRVILIVMDSVGVGELPDAAAYGDEGSNTVGNIARAVPLRVPTLRSLGLASRRGHRGRDGVADRRIRADGGDVGGQRLGHRALGNDGRRPRTAVSDVSRAVFRLTLIREFERRIGRRTIGNVVASGTAIIDDPGRRARANRRADRLHLGRLACSRSPRTSQIVPIDELYRLVRRRLRSGRARAWASAG